MIIYGSNIYLKSVFDKSAVLEGFLHLSSVILKRLCCVLTSRARGQSHHDAVYFGWREPVLLQEIKFRTT